MGQHDVITLRGFLGPNMQGRTISDARQRLLLSDLLARSCLARPVSELAGRSVLLATSSQLLSAAVMIELDGIARRMLVCPPDLDRDQVDALIDEADIEVIVTDQPPRWSDAGVYLIIGIHAPEHSFAHAVSERPTEWLLPIVSSACLPLIAAQTLEDLIGPSAAVEAANGPGALWASFEDIRGHHGLPVFVRALAWGGSMVFAEPGEAAARYVDRLADSGVTHISGTASHWRELLESGKASRLSPSYVRLAGGSGDRTVLDTLACTFPGVSIEEAGVPTEAPGWRSRR